MLDMNSFDFDIKNNIDRLMKIAEKEFPEQIKKFWHVSVVFWDDNTWEIEIKHRNTIHKSYSRQTFDEAFILSWRKQDNMIKVMHDTEEVKRIYLDSSTGEQIDESTL